MIRLFAFCLSIAVLTLPLPGRAAGVVDVLGLKIHWNIEETIDAFERAGIMPKDFGDDEEMRQKVEAVSEAMLKAIGNSLNYSTKIYSFTDFEEWRPEECLYYENALQQRDDIEVLAVCFYGKEWMVVIMPFFRTGEIKVSDLREYLENLYSVPDEKSELVQYFGTHYFRPEAEIQDYDIYLDYPWYYGKLIERRYIVLLAFEPFSLFGVAAAIGYIDVSRLLEAQKDVRAAAEEMQKTSEQPKKGVGKGL